MAHAATLSALTDELVESIVAYDSSRSDARAVIKAFKESALKNLRYHRFGRTNQFIVQKSLEGLVEKFQVLNNDPLADALDSRLQELADVESKWKPEILSLLLLLSENPATEASVGDLDKLKPRQAPPQPTWDDLFGSDSPTEEGLWHSAASTSDSSDDQVVSPSESLPDLSQHSTFSQSAAPGLDENRRAESLIVPVDAATVQDIGNGTGRFAVNASGEQLRLTELQAVRQVLNMLRGLPSHLFEIDIKNASIVPVNGHTVDHMSRAAFADLQSAFSQHGSDLHVLREFVSRRQRHPLLRALVSTIDRQIQMVNRTLTDIETSFVKGEGQVVVSLLQVLARMRRDLRHLSFLKDIVVRAGELDDSHNYSLLDDLYDQTCTMQAMGDDSAFEVLTAIFLDCLNMYLRPIRQWMGSGELDESLELISAPPSDAIEDPALFWKHRFSLVSHDGHWAAPQFLIPFVAYMFAAGKSVAFLKELGVESEGAASLAADEPLLKLSTTDEASDEINLLPFSVLLGQALHDWVKSRHQLTSAPLCDHLLHDHGLSQTIDALERLYLSRDGTVFENFADEIFNRLDSGKQTWNDVYSMEQIAQHVFGVTTCIESACISAEKPTSSNEPEAKTVNSLSSIRLIYTYPWPAQNIIPTASLGTYQHIFTFLLQTYRASSILSTNRFRTRHIHPSTTISNPISAAVDDHNPSTKVQAHNLAQHLHHRLLHFILTLRDYMTHTAIQHSCLAFRASLAAARDVDAMIAAHASLIFSLERRCLLVKEVDTARNALTRLLDLACAFANLLAVMRGGPSASQDRLETPASETAPGSDSGTDDEGGDREADGVTTREGAEEAGERGPKSDEPAEAQAMDYAAFVTKLRQMKTQYAHLLSIVVASLRGAKREEGGEEAWEELCESLEWSLGR